MELSNDQIERIITALEGINDSLDTLAYGHDGLGLEPIAREISIVSDCLGKVSNSVDRVADNSEC